MQRNSTCLRLFFWIQMFCYSSYPYSPDIKFLKFLLFHKEEPFKTFPSFQKNNLICFVSWRRNFQTALCARNKNNVIFISWCKRRCKICCFAPKSNQISLLNSEIAKLITKLRERFNEAPQLFPFLESCLRNINNNIQFNPRGFFHCDLLFCNLLILKREIKKIGGQRIIIRNWCPGKEWQRSIQAR